MGECQARVGRSLEAWRWTEIGGVNDVAKNAGPGDYAEDEREVEIQ